MAIRPPAGAQSGTIVADSVITAIDNTQGAMGDTSYGDLSGGTAVGPAATATIGASGRAMVIVSAQLLNSGAGGTYASFAVSGATTRAAATAEAVSGGQGNEWAAASRVSILTGLTPGSNVFTMKYVVDSGTGQVSRRAITVIPL